MKKLTALLVLGSLVFPAFSAYAYETKEYNGLSKEEVQLALGKPSAKSTEDGGPIDVWVYGNGAGYITFENGKIINCEFAGDRSSTTLANSSPTAIISPALSNTTSIANPDTTSNSYINRYASTNATASCATKVPNAYNSNTTYLGKLSTNKYDPNSISNSYGVYGSKYGNTLNNSYDQYGNRYSSTSITNPYALDTPKIYAVDGTYLGKLSSNKYDPESISNPYGRYGSKYGNNLMNPYSQYGSKYSPLSWNNPYTTTAPSIYSNNSYSTFTLPRYGR